MATFDEALVPGPGQVPFEVFRALPKTDLHVHLDGSLRLDGKSYVVAGPLPLAIREKTFEAWVKLDSYGVNPTIVGKGGSYELVLASSGLDAGRLGWKLTQGATTTIVATNRTDALALGRWYHVVATYDGATMAIYVDGVLRISRAQTGAAEQPGLAATAS